MTTKRKFPKVITRSEIRWRVFSVVVLVIISILITVPTSVNQLIASFNDKTNLGLPYLPEKSFNLGLDLQGGAHLEYVAKVDNIPPAERSSSVEGVRDVIERRVRGGLGVSEPLVQTTRVGDECRVIVELPGVADVHEAIKMIGETPVLEFKEENKEPPRELTAEEKKELFDFNTQADKKINEAKKELSRGVDFTSLVNKYSEDEYSKVDSGVIGYLDGSIYPEIYDWAAKNTIGAISKNEIIKTDDGYNLLRKTNERDGEKQIAASHLLICYKGAQYCESNLSKGDAKAKIESIKNEITKENFVELVKTHSTEPGADTYGGDLGFFKKGQMVASFEEAIFDIPVGEIVGPIETEFGWHLIYKTGEKTPKEYEVARIFVASKSELDILPPAEQWKFTGLTGKQLRKAEILQDQRSGQIQVSLSFNDEGTKLFGEITTNNVGSLVAIFLDGQPISVPRVNEPILDGSAVISGDFTWEEAKLLAQRLNSGALPVAVELVGQQTVDATLGLDSLQASLKAGLWGLLLVAIIMILYYRLAGLIAIIALGGYAFIVLAIFKLLGVTLTLSGIAGFILSVGMAVDANVLVFERLKEELKGGKKLKSAIEEAFIRAWTSIRDSNITTMISCMFLIWMGVGFVEGFAVTLLIGILVSMFTAIVVTRNMMRLVVGWFKNDEPNWLFLGGKKDETQSDNKI